MTLPIREVTGLIPGEPPEPNSLEGAKSIRQVVCWGTKYATTFFLLGWSCFYKYCNILQGHCVALLLHLFTNTFLKIDIWSNQIQQGIWVNVNSNNVMMVYSIDLDTIPPCSHVIEPVWLWLQTKVDLCWEHSGCCTLFAMRCVLLIPNLTYKSIEINIWSENSKTTSNNSVQKLGRF